ncbi:glycosyltransferase [Rhodococcus zopfii]|uniref:glycosyltransferase n=2 Tax=Rhodococcus zopfii TaxID=43772 RepID=UPI000AC5CA4F|nr:glycosyltransferase [Rhodococcus zopfii]
MTRSGAAVITRCGAAVITRCGAAVALLGAVTAVANRLSLPRLEPGAATAEPVTVLVPARDEAHRVPDLVADLCAQQGVPGMRVIVLDDDSSDGTADAARQAAAGDDRIVVVRSTQPPPAGWTGKAAACAHAYRIAGAGAGVVVFVDADVRLAPQALAAAVTSLRRMRADLLSPWPFQVAGSRAEKLLQPLLCWSWFSSLPVAVANRTTRPSMAVACGQFLVFDARAYAAIGGHAVVAASPTEDLDLARTLRTAGRRTVVAAAGPFASCRMYLDRRQLAAGYTRWLWSAFGSPVGAVAVLAGYTLAYVLPPVSAIAGRGAVRRWGLAGTAAALVSRALARSAERGTAVTGSDAVSALGHPAAIAGFGALTVASLRARRRGRTDWKNRPLP